MEKRIISEEENLYPSMNFKKFLKILLASNTGLFIAIALFLLVQRGEVDNLKDYLEDSQDSDAIISYVLEGFSENEVLTYLQNNCIISYNNTVIENRLFISPNLGISLRTDDAFHRVIRQIAETRELDFETYSFLLQNVPNIERSSLSCNLSTIYINTYGNRIKRNDEDISNVSTFDQNFFNEVDQLLLSMHNEGLIPDPLEINPLNIRLTTYLVDIEGLTELRISLKLNYSGGIEILNCEINENQIGPILRLAIVESIIEGMSGYFDQNAQL